jgi:hypothetical protein
VIYLKQSKLRVEKMKKYLNFRKFIAVCCFLSALLISNVSYARCFSLPCIWTRIVKANFGVPGFDYLQIGPEAISMVQGFVMADTTSTIASNDAIDFKALTSSTAFSSLGVNISGVGDLVSMAKDIQGTVKGFDIFSPDDDVASAVVSALKILNKGGTDATSKVIATSIKNLVVVKPEGLSFAEDQAWLKQRKKFFEESWLGGYSQALATQQKISEQMEGVQNFITAVGDIGSAGSKEDNVKKMMDKYKASVVALKAAKLLVLQTTASKQALEATEGLANNKTDDYQPGA